MEMVELFCKSQQIKGLAQITIDTYRPVLKALASKAPDWPPTVEEITDLINVHHKGEYSDVTRAEYWNRLNGWFNWCQEKYYIGLNPMAQVPRPLMPTVEAEIVRPKDFVKTRVNTDSTK